MKSEGDKGQRTALAGVSQPTHQADQAERTRQGKGSVRAMSVVKAARLPINALERRQMGLRRALARLEREHVALLLALCELGAETTVGTKRQSAPSNALRAALAPMLRDDLRQTQYALARAAQGQYGVCAHCGHAIPLRRLEVRPNTTACEGCETRRTNAR